jgi:hypothetical protein
MRRNLTPGDFASGLPLSVMASLFLAGTRTVVRTATSCAA